jgi:heptosyltransferase-1
MPSILFVKTSSLGDIVHNGPAVSDARRALPGASIDWVVEESFAEIARLHPAVRRVIPVAVRRWRTRLYDPATWRELAAFRRALCAERYQRVIDTQGLLKSALIAASARGEKHGFDSASAREPLAARLYDVRHAVPKAIHAVERNRALACAALDTSVAGAVDYGFVADALAVPAAEGPCVVLLTMTSRADKLWPEAQWRELVAWLGAHGLACLLPWGSAAERERCARIAAGWAHARVPERMALAELAATLVKARAVAGVDTGLTHLAAGLGVPVVGIFCGSDPALTGLYGAARIRSLGAPGMPPRADEVCAALEAWL